jgi:hypothetical protein
MPSENEASRYIALALVGCVHCKGLGTSGQGACICVDRSVFRIVLNKFRQCASGGHLGRPFSLNGTSRAQGRVSDGRKNEDYMADVFLVSKRILTDPTEWAIFRFHHLLGADWKLCGRRLGMDKGNFFHAVYRIEAKLGKVFRELQPYPLFPIDEYFQGNTRRVAVLPFPVQPARLGTPLRPPLAVRPVAPAPVPIPDTTPLATVKVLESVPMVPPDIADVPALVRSWRGEGVSARACAARLNRSNVPSTRGSKFYTSDIWRLLMDAPREQAPAKRAA